MKVRDGATLARRWRELQTKALAAPKADCVCCGRSVPDTINTRKPEGIVCMACQTRWFCTCGKPFHDGPCVGCSEDPYGCVMFCRAPGGRICPKCEPALYAQFYPSATEGGAP